jgi:hypothetical protein|nr:MAG TPA: hypothetical protein [Caudoviricetes sp.]
MPELNLEAIEPTESELVETNSPQKIIYKGQMPNEKNACFCEKEGRWLKTDNFYTYRDGSHPKMCKSCLTMHIDNFNEETFLWLFQENEFDIPYVPSWWVHLRNKELAKAPRGLKGTSVFGKYLSKTKMTQYKDLRYKDSEEAQQMAGEVLYNGSAAEEERRRATNLEVQLKKDFEEGKISRAEYETKMPAIRSNQELLYAQQFEGRMMAGAEFQQVQPDYFPQDELPSPGADLTHDDKVYLAMKWGRLYSPDEWVQLERDYQGMVENLGAKDTDTKNTIILICKANLKMNKAMDMGDTEDALKQSRMYDMLRKSLKQVAAQHKEGAGFLNSVGEMVAYCEKSGGAIPRHQISAPIDIVDKVIKDLKEYNKSLIYADASLGGQIEDYLKAKAILDQKKRDRQGGQKNETEDSDFSEFQERMKNLKEEEESTEEDES